MSAAENQRSPSASPQSSQHGSNTDISNNNSNEATPTVSHSRSRSAELVDNPSFFMDAKYSASLTEPLNMKEVRAQNLSHGASPERSATPPGSVSNLRAERSNSQGSVTKTKPHNNNTVQQIPSKLAVSSTTKAKTPTKNKLPMNLAESKKRDSKTPQKTKDGQDVIYF